ncbi:hypothetical protein J7E93_32720 [Streptomyces sp. ISL-36]|uniref:hypothetical protein n=1 Tax=Streptomyces sp. ISL-36 TaxID=2819182 RepID=UPI001BECFE20|nr:hypothetical protein [Streptomyces sp. ISL-36]MBT2444777.1 hypothetical protein [Streptomyces sp. ISL-36]
MLDGSMVRKREKRKRPSFGMPKGIVLLATPKGWRHSVLTVEGGMLCGRLADVPINADPHEARTAAAAMVVGLTRNFHDSDVEVTWDPPQEPWSWTGQVTPSREMAPPRLTPE